MSSPQRARICAARRLLAALIAGIAGIASRVPDANAFSDGIIVVSGKQNTFCSSCHVGSGSAPAVELEAPGGTEMAAGAVATFRFRITSSVAAQTHAGLNVAAEAGDLDASEAGTQAFPFLGLDEITHTTPRRSTDGVTVFEFAWRAPDTPGTYTLFGAGNSVNNNGDQFGDDSARTTIDITVSGPPTPTPAATATPSATVTPTQPMGPCVGDCSGDDRVTVDEVVTGVNIALGTVGVGNCPAFDRDESGSVTVDELVEAIQRALQGCESSL